MRKRSMPPSQSVATAFMLLWIALLASHRMIADEIPRPSKDALTSERDASAAMGLLRLRNGDTYHGTLIREAKKPIGPSSDFDERLYWSCPSFLSPFAISWNEVDSLNLPVRSGAGSDGPTPQFCVQFHSGEAISGFISKIDKESIQMESPLYGSQSIPLRSIQCILRVLKPQSSEIQSVSVNAWQQTLPPLKNGRGAKWYRQAGSIDTDVAGTSISQSIVLPELASIDVQTTWDQTSPNWLLTIGEPRELELHVRKVQNKKLLMITLLVENEVTADVARAQFPLEGAKAISLRLLCDAKHHRYVLQYKNQTIAELKLKGRSDLVGKKSVIVTNMAEGHFSLKELTVSKSIFSLPNATGATAESPSILLEDGQSFFGSPEAFDTTTRKLQLSGNASVLGPIDIDRIDRIEFPNPSETDVVAAAPHRFVVEMESGARYAGTAIVSNQDHIELSSQAFKNGIRIPLGEVRSVTHIAPPDPNATTPEEPSAEKWPLRLVTSTAISTGQLVTQTQSNASESVGWQPSKVMTSVAISPNTSGVLEPILRNVAKAKSKVNPVNNGQENEYGHPLKPADPSLFLVNGDCFPAKIETCDEDTLRFKSNLFDVQAIDSSLVRGFRLLAYSGTEKIDKDTRKRFLTLPRVQRKNPPSHVIVSREGDFIRGRLIALSTDLAIIEVRGEEKKIAMKNVAEIIWLQPAPKIESSALPARENAAPTADEPAAADRDPSEPPEQDLTFQIVTTTGSRFSMIPKKTVDSNLYGSHSKLGACNVDFDSVASIFLGDAGQEDAARNRFSKWKLMNAPDPKFVNDLDEPAGDSSQEDGNVAQRSPLIDLIAPEFELDDMEGQSRTNEEFRGKVVILDFFATWCGPCIASMPKMVELSHEYKGANVELIAINLEERPEDVRKLLDRLDINPRVLLDRDGSISQKYGVKSIPQTVIIDAEGVVRHVFVGGGNQVDAQIRQALDEMIHIQL